MDNKWVYDVDNTKQTCYQPVEDCTYWPVLGFFNNQNIIQFTNKTTSSEDFDELHKVVLDGISDNMASIVQLGKYGSINALYPTKMNYYVINIYLNHIHYKNIKTNMGK